MTVIPIAREISAAAVHRHLLGASHDELNVLAAAVPQPVGVGEHYAREHIVHGVIELRLALKARVAPESSADRAAQDIAQPAPGEKLGIEPRHGDGGAPC